MKYLVVILFIINSGFLFGQNLKDSLMVNYDLNEIVVFNSYPINSSKEEKKFQQLEQDIQVVYPLLKIVRTEYKRVNDELLLYQGDREKVFMKWYENYARESYMHNLSTLNYRQGRLFLVLISRELDNTPYDIIKEYRNDFRAFLWQGIARVFFANLKVEYSKGDNPMIEYLMKKMDAQNGA